MSSPVSSPGSPTVSRRPVRAAAAALTLGLLVGTLTACGEDGAEVPEGAVEGLDAVQVAGDVGESPEVEFTDQMGVPETESEVLVEGDGPELGQGDSAFVHIYIGNGFTQEQAFNTYDAGRPEVLQVSDQLTPGVLRGLEGQQVGSRVAVAATPEDAFGENGNPQLQIGNKDSVLFVVDILGEVQQEVGDTRAKPGGPVPKLVFTQGTLTKLDFPPALKATGKLQVRTLIEGDGEEIGPDSTLAVRYLGQVLGNDTPFDESFSAPDPTVFPITDVVQGWTRGLQGVTAGSRVVLVIPPKLGYGKQGQPSAGIKGDDTMVFVIDVLGVA